VRRLVAIALLIAALTPVLWLREDVRYPKGPAMLRFTRLSTEGVDPRQLGPFKLEQAWSLGERDGRYGGFSGLVAWGDGRLFTVSDSGQSLEFDAPDAMLRTGPIGGIVLSADAGKFGRDVEAATADPDTRRVWLGVEFYNKLMRMDYRGGRLRGGRQVRPATMRDWGSNSGPEALARLSDGRFLTIREGFDGLFERSRHPALLFAGDPVSNPRAAKAFTFFGPRGYSPTDAAELPDGRVLVLLRRVLWPMPPRFAGAIAIGDPRSIRQGREWPVRVLATWGGGLPVDNFEGLAVEPQAARDSGTRLTVWLISDNNNGVLQKTVLWKLRLDPERLPARREAGRPAEKSLTRRPFVPS